MYRPDDSGVTETGALVVMLLAGLGLAILAYIFMPTVAGALECRERPGDSKTYWSYRIIDSQRCWYPGHGRKPKSELHWSDEPKPKKLKGDPVFNQIRAQETVELPAVAWHMHRPFDQAAPLTPPLNIAVPDEPDACCWPPLSDFDRRFTGEPR